jgi:PAS domain S-box-containing protein
MEDEDKSKEQLIKEMLKLRQRIDKYKKTEINSKRTNKALREEIKTLFTILEHQPVGIAMIDKEGKYKYINPEFTNITGYTLKEIAAGKDWFEKVYPNPSYREKVIESWKKDRLSEESKSSDREFIITCKNGQNKHIEFRTTHLSDYSIIVMTDITTQKEAKEEKEKLQTQLFHAQKLESIGQLAGGIAHDFNNIISAIMGYGEILKIKMDKDDPKRKYAENILASSEKAAGLTQSLLTFSRKQAIELKPHKINTLIKSMEKILRRLLTEDIDLEIISEDPDVTVMADKAQIDQVLMNIAANAHDAMPKGGKFIIETKRVRPDIEFLQMHGYSEQGEYVLISIKDTGTGMDEKTKDQIFDPFFTTKEVGKGTGLGLSIAYGIIKQHNGFIDAYSDLEVGTTFYIYIPAIKTAEEEKPETHEIKGGTETILVAEDNAELRELAVMMLDMAGYTVIDAVDGEDAVKRFMEHKDDVDLLILDVIMPKKNGKEAYEEIKRINPDIKVLFTSGYTRDVVINKGVHDKTVNFIKKPLSSYDLLDKIREVLNN